jgi:hypothetical protein
MHLKEVVTFVANEATPDVSMFRNVLDIVLLSGTTMRLRKNMMDVTILLTAAAATKIKTDAKEYCQLANSEGFFSAALPVAYYTIQQLELVNDQLNYNYKRSAKSFKKIVEAFRDVAFQGSTRKISVSMMSKREDRVSLFHEICKSASECEDTIQDDLKGFLEEACLWGSTDAYSPVVFFQTLRIFSLQSAIDFAFDVQTGQNDAYSKMLLSYPIGTQIVIKQCMKKLTENGAYGYLMNDIDEYDNLDDISGDEAEEEEKTSTLVGRMIKSISAGKKTAWKFEEVATITSTSPGDNALAILILTEYKKKTKWTLSQGDGGSAPDDILKAKIIDQLKHNGPGDIDLHVPEFLPDEAYTTEDDVANKFTVRPILAQNVLVHSDEVFRLVGGRDTLVVQTQWGAKFAQFTFIKPQVMRELISDFAAISGRIARRPFAWIFG